MAKKRLGPEQVVTKLRQITSGTKQMDPITISL
jgi:hypothetical protein